MTGARRSLSIAMVVLITVAFPMFAAGEELIHEAAQTGGGKDRGFAHLRLLDDVIAAGVPAGEE